ncbi:unnamed protein product [Linum tenue]|uniref:AB hydrolase-1 domain-containing protein n=1 Tax=Linum tenue TaxID=586396 RepID=A0AAV0KIE6_9ROSI|nr:unnamed protein product [Linum tenue]CAI0420626.1 unnamed protein product [Linum tenue]
MLFRITVILLIGLLTSAAYQAFRPPPPKICGTPGGPPVTAPRIKLRDGRHLAYKEHGLPKDVAKHKIVFVHGFTSCRLDPMIVTNLTPEVIEELGVYVVTFDRPGYGESDPDPNRTPKSLALDIEELADGLGLGSRFYVMGKSMGEAYNLQLPQDQWALRVAHHAPWLTYWWNTQKLFPSSGVISRKRETMSRQDIELVSTYGGGHDLKKEATQQGEFESLHRDMMIGFGKWEFDPMDLENPFPNNEGSVHLWQGDDDKKVPVILQRYIAQKLPWIHYHELPGGGHVLHFVPGLIEGVLRALLRGGK